MRFLILSFLLLPILSACSLSPSKIGYAESISMPSPNQGPRKPVLVVLHHTGSQSPTTSLAILGATDTSSPVSAHYVVSPDGTVWNLVSEDRRAWHAGVSYWNGFRDINSLSIGIEMVNDGKSPYPSQQIDSLLKLLVDLKNRYALPREAFIAHADIAPGRKVDPGINFPWEYLRSKGFGATCDEEMFPNEHLKDPMNVLADLAQIGYDVSIPDSAIKSFLISFRAKDSGDMDENDIKIAACVARSVKK